MIKELHDNAELPDDQYNQELEKIREYLANTKS